MSHSRRVRHVVLVKFRAEATEAEREEFVRRSQWSRSSGYVEAFACGWQVQPNPYAAATQDWDWAMTLDYEADDVSRYRDDPVHRAVGAEVGRFAERYAIVDFVME